MKQELKWLLLLIGWIILIGLVGPWLVSAPSTMAVVAGFVILGASAYSTYRFVLKQKKA